MIRTLLVDDHKIMRQGLAQILSETADIEVVAEASNGREALELVRSRALDVVVLDVSMPEMDGFSTLQALKHEHPKLAVLVLSMYPEEQYAIRFLRAGAAGYLTKESASDELIEAIRKVASGGRYVTHSLAERLVSDLGGETHKGDISLLSNREFQTLRLIAAGRTVGEIAAELSLSVKTISTYRTRILDKLDLHSTADIVRYALEHELI
jgi:DNA-binding NarL/FixJ family response regulator